MMTVWGTPDRERDRRAEEGAYRITEEIELRGSSSSTVTVTGVVDAHRLQSLCVCSWLCPVRGGAPPWTISRTCAQQWSGCSVGWLHPTPREQKRRGEERMGERVKSTR